MKLKHIKLLKWVSFVTTIFMFFATFGGGVVTRTESGLGCGNEWPLCHGKFVPAHTLASLIEYSHRIVSSTAGLLAVATFVLFWLYSKKRRDLQIFALLTLIFVIIQGAMGALAVVFSQSPPVMALHLGFAFISLASALMTTLGARQEEKFGGLERFDRLPRVSKGFRNLVWITAIYSYVVVYTGAFVSHTSSAGGCSGFPLCNGEVVPQLSGGVGIAFMHRAAAFLLVAVVAVLSHYAYRHHKNNREMQVLGLSAIGLIILQVLSGVGLMLTMNRPEVYMFVVLAHMTIIAVLFGMLCYMSYVVWRLAKPAGSNKL
ncbi:heme A synthase [Paenibacillus sp. FSL H7-0326]|uniref:COX15/CtaA family protein n=1 Tax=Paenibacillus sp. FSL H7-0326 TaxID=1921144 RepID=UPI00096E8B11|nr:heme A synthase [Paenibacillus sp. FSL H7-0326]OMC64810.1 heme A synthase [Paenibacillus sp. FSL H7-0326]